MKNPFLSCLLLTALASHGEIIGQLTISARITADNGFSLYSGSADGTRLAYIGRSSHIEGWWVADSFTFQHLPGDYLYLAGWSDNYWAQGVLGQFQVAGGETILTGSGWQAHLTHRDNPTISSVFLPPLAEVASEIGENSWASIVHAVPNGGHPWGLREGIDPAAQWMWGSPLISGGGYWDGGSGYGEYQIFRIQVGNPAEAVPEPGTVMTMGIGLAGLAFLAFRRRRI